MYNLHTIKFFLQSPFERNKFFECNWIRILRQDGLLHNIIEGAVEGTNARGRQRKEYLDDIIDELGCTDYRGLKRAAQDREAGEDAGKRCKPISRL